MFDLYCADVTGMEQNNRYPNRVTVSDAESLLTAVSRDYVCAAYRNAHRSKADFLSSDCVPLDFDNDHSDDPQEWIYPEDVLIAFPDVTVGIHYSRHHMKIKNGRTPRPKFHALLACKPVSDVASYDRLKKRVAAVFPQCDPNALDAARFFYGTENPRAEFWPGSLTVEDVLADAPDEPDFDENLAPGTYGERVIKEGSRNATLSRTAGKLVKRFGWNEDSREKFFREAEKCEVPLPDDELEKIWLSARRFAKLVQSQPDYIPPEQYRSGPLLKPSDYSDIGQAKAIAGDCACELVYTPGTEYLTYNGQYWDESKQKAVGLVESFLDRQLKDAEAELSAAREALVQSGMREMLVKAGGKELEKQIGADQLPAYYRLLAASSYKAFVMKRRDMKYISSAMLALKPMVEIDQASLDKDENLLNCPDGTYDLRKGMAGRKDHEAEDLITKITPYAPGTQGEDLWLDTVNKVFQGDTELIEYVQRIVGLAAVGEVYQEALIIAYGDGSNGKSTFWNSIAGAMGTYGGLISADVLTVGCRRNVKPELAEVKGKRILIAAELEEGTRLSTSIVKQLCSTDQIEGEKKYKDPFKFDPSHMLVLYTNHLPKVGAMDTGIWRRLIVIPFNAKLGGGGADVKNYAKFLLKNAGPAITKWIIEGAEKVIRDHFNLVLPACVQEAIRKYQADNDWLTHFMEECCVIEDGAEARSGEVWDSYKAYCARTGDFIRSTTEFYTALENRGFHKVKRKQGRFIPGLRIADCPVDFD